MSESKTALEGVADRLGPLRLAAYSAPSFITSVAALPVTLFVPAYYADELGVSLASVGLAIGLSRLFDVVTDPLIGSLSDRWRFKLFGGARRKPWMVLGVPVFILAAWQLFVPPAEVTWLWLFASSTFMYLGFTLIDLPHKAWGAELSDDYHERSSITSVREAIGTLGQVLLLAGLALAAAGGIDDSETQLRAIAIAILVLLPLLVLVCLYFVSEPPAAAARDERVGTWEGLKIVGRNPAFVRMIACVLFFVSGIAIQGTLHRLVLTDVMNDASQFTSMILFENVGTLLAVPVWLYISKRIEKATALICAAMWIAVWSLPLVWLREGDVVTMIAVVVVRGSSFASILFLANSIAADVIDADHLESGEPRAGFFFAAWGMVIKLSLALGVALGTMLPAAFGYDPSADVITPETQARLMAIYGGLPAVMMGIGALFLRNFPIDQERQAEIREQLESRGAA